MLTAEDSEGMSVLPVPPAPGADRNALLVSAFAESVAEEIQNSLHPSLWHAVVARIEEKLARVGEREPRERGPGEE